MSFLRQAAILTRISFKVFFSKIKKFVTYLLRAIFNIDLHFLKTPSKSCFCYLVKFVRILYVLILFIFLKKIGLLHQNEAHDSEFEYHEKEMDNSKLTSSWPSPFKTRYLRPDKCILESFNSD